MLRSFTGAGNGPISGTLAALANVLRPLGIGECSRRWYRWEFRRMEIEKCDATFRRWATLMLDIAARQRRNGEGFAVNLPGGTVGFIRIPPFGSWATTDVSPPPLGEKCLKVLEVLAAHSVAMTQRAIRDETSFNTKMVVDILDKLMAAGRVMSRNFVRCEKSLS